MDLSQVQEIIDVLIANLPQITAIFTIASLFVVGMVISSLKREQSNDIEENISYIMAVSRRVGDIEAKLSKIEDLDDECFVLKVTLEELGKDIAKLKVAPKKKKARK